MKFFNYPKRKADTIAHGVFLISLGILFYTGEWWPGILYALGILIGLKNLLSGRIVDFIITMVFIVILSLLTLAGSMFSLLFPIIFIGLGLYLIAKECLFSKKMLWKYPSESETE